MTVITKSNRSTPGAARALLLVALGYAYLVLVLVASVVGGVILIRTWPWLSRIVVQLGFGYLLVMIEALWVRVPKPTGKRVTRAGSPRLIAEIQKIATRLDAPVPDQILLTADFNAGAAEQPRFGIFGSPTRYLLIGLPLMSALRADEMSAVIGHELAHLSRRHGRLSLLIARVSVSWTVLAMHIASSRRYVSWLYLPFFGWYIPKLQATADRLSRGHEHESDELAASATSAEVMARALLRMGIQRRRLLRIFVPKTLAETAQSSSPPADIAARMENYLSAGYGAPEIEEDVVAALQERTADDDTHPSLSERLAALGVAIEVPRLATALADTSSSSASASDLLGQSRLANLRVQLDADILSPFTKSWPQLTALVEVWRATDGSRREGREAGLAFAKWAGRTQPPADAIAALRQARAFAPNDSEVSFMLGALLLGEADPTVTEEAIGVLEHVAASETAFGFAACTLLRQAYQRVERPSELARIGNRESELRAANLMTLRERSAVGADDQFQPAGLSPQVVSKLVEFLATKPEVLRVLLVTKKTNSFRGLPLYVIAIQRRVAWYRYENGKAGFELCQQSLKFIDLGAGGDLRVMVVESGSRLLRKLRSIPGATIFDRAPHEKLSPASRLLPNWSKPKWVPSFRVLLIGLFIGVPVLGRFLPQPDNDRLDLETQSASQWANGVTPQAELFGRSFVHLLQVGNVDSAASLVSATAREADSLSWARKLASRVPHEPQGRVRRTLGFELREGTVTRDLMAYAIVADADTTTVVVQTVEELGLRYVEYAEVRHGNMTREALKQLQ